jgi:hypothetical protein
MPIHDWTCVGAGIFHDFHHEWISTVKRALNTGLLPPDYYALAEQITGGLGPDVLTLESVRAVPPQAASEVTARSGTKHGVGIALATAPPKVRFTAAAETERYARKRGRITIRHASSDQVVAVLEIVSPGNKTSRHALRSFVDKAVELLDAGVHLLVIDLFPPGPRDPQGIHGAIWSEIEGSDFQLPPEQPLTVVAYSAGEVMQAFIEPIAAGDALPDMPLFLQPDRYVPVPLEASYQAAFDAVPKRWQEALRPSPASQ